MIISFSSRELRDACASLEKAEARFGSAYAQEIITLIAEAEAVESAADLLELYQGDAKIQNDSISVPIGIKYKVHFVSVNAAAAQDGCIDWRAVQRLKIVDLSS